MKISGNKTVESAKDFQQNLYKNLPVFRNHGDQQCLPSNLKEGILEQHHKCLVAGCISNLDDVLIQQVILDSASKLLPDHLKSEFECMVKSGHVQADNWKEVVDKLRVASLLKPEEVLGSLPLVHLDKDYKGVKIVLVRSPKWKRKMTLGLGEVSLSNRFENKNICEMNNFYDLIFPESNEDIESLVQCPYTYINFPGLPNLEGSFEGCCDFPSCYLPRYLTNSPSFIKSGIASYVSPWMSWSSCSKTCDEGERKRRRRCIGKTCKLQLEEIEKCNLRSCPKVSEWSEYSSCSASCGRGTKKRIRRCQARSCSVPLEEIIPCQLPPCLAASSDWQMWSTCSCEKGKGVQMRKRSCSSSLSVFCSENKIQKRRCKAACKLKKNKRNLKSKV